ncbi:MAG: ABC transporter ATP-binding protein [Armatimonadetes bacterium]|nr:ABC transporter ATP-binding protein [Armatimonadota bacterium]
MSEVLVEAKGIGKRYRRGMLGGIRLPRLFGRRSGDGADDEFWALKDIDLELREGDSLGIIGPNGAGKSTLLKILSRVTAPTEGVLKVRGRVGALIEVGAGFHQELSGRDNIFINGAILGMSRKEIQRRFDEIVAFAELEDFIDTPVKKYSSGMYVRLGFAVAAHMDPDILLIDEVLAVGDMSFQRKCIQFSRRVNERGTTVVLVSHNLAQVEAFCTNAVLLRQGNIVERGRTPEVITVYARSQRSLSEECMGSDSENAQTGLVRIHSVEVASQEGETMASTVNFGSPVLFRIAYSLLEPMETPHFQIILLRSDGLKVGSIHSRLDSNADAATQQPGRYMAEARLETCRLVPDSYAIEVWATDSQHTMDYGMDRSTHFEVVGPATVDSKRYGAYVPRGLWTFSLAQEQTTGRSFIDTQSNAKGDGAAV